MKDEFGGHMKSKITLLTVFATVLSLVVLLLLGGCATRNFKGMPVPVLPWDGD